MTTYTPNYRFALPALDSVGWDTSVNNNFSALDSLIATLTGYTPGSIVAAASGYVGSVGWLEPIIGATESIATFRGMSATGGVGVLGAAKLGGVGGSAFGVMAIAVLDTATNPGWPLYVEGRRYNGSGILHNIESNAVNCGEEIVIDPFTFPPTASVALHLTSGRPDVAASKNTSAAITIFGNGTQFLTGIVFHNVGIRAHTVLSGETWSRPLAIDLPYTYGIGMRNGTDGHISGGIWSEVVNPSGGGYICFIDTGTSFRNVGNTEVVRIGFNGFSTAAGVTSTFNGPLITAAGVAVNLQGGVAMQGAVSMPNLVGFANNAAAIAGGVPVGGLYINITTYVLTVAH